MDFPSLSYGEERKDPGADAPESFLISNKTTQITDPQETLIDELDQLLSTPRGTPSLPRFPRPGVPQFPGSNMIRVAKVPPPPLLKKSFDALSRFDRVARAWIGAVRGVYGVESWTFRGAIGKHGTGQKSKHWRLVLAAAGRLIEHELAPATWLGFSFDVWKNYVAKENEKKRNAPPPITWVLSPTRIDKQRGWCRRESEEYAGGHLFFADEHMELLRQYSRMKVAVRRLPLEATEAEVIETVDRFFHDKSYETFVEEAQRASDRMQERLHAMVARGDWPWPK
jgi:hypothetical protein